MYLLLLPLLLSCPQDSTEIQQRADDLEQVRQELDAKIDALADELERRDLGELAPSELTRVSGMGLAASRIYSRDQGTSIGGYGEFLYNLPAGANNTFDALRGVLYVGHRFDEHWLVNTEIEFEHGSTSKSGSASLEFGYVEYLPNDAFAVRGGLLLVPMGLVNENHEPTAYLPVSRPKVEQKIMPSTWREMGLGAWGRTGSLEWHTYVVNGLAGENFDESGLRGGRQKGSKADAEDLAFVQRLDWSLSPGLVLGTSFYVGNSAGSNESLGGSLGTRIFEVHSTWEEGPWSLQALAAQAELDGAQEFNESFVPASNPNLANAMHGAYLQVGYNLLANTSGFCQLINHFSGD